MSSMSSGHDTQAEKIAQWVAAGCPSPPPHLVKVATLQSYLKRFGCDVFIETGSGEGATTAAMASLGIECHTIEIDTARHARIANRFCDMPNVTAHHGDSALVLPKLLASLTGRALFWLDAHYSWDGLERAEKETPINEEIDSVLNHPVKGHVIMVDDMRLFGNHVGERYKDYPTLEQLKTVFAKYNVDVSVQYDIMRVVPQGPVAVAAA